MKITITINLIRYRMNWKFVMFFFTIMIPIKNINAQLTVNISSDTYNKKYYENLSPLKKTVLGTKKNSYLQKKVKAKDIEAIKEVAFNAVYDEFGYYKKTLDSGYLKGKSFVWFEAGALLNDPESLYNLGLHYYFDYGVPRNEEKALNAFKQANDLGFYQAESMIGLMYYDRAEQEHDIEKGANILLKHTENCKQPLVNFALAKIFLNNKFIKNDTLKSINLLIKSKLYKQSRHLLVELYNTDHKSKIVDLLMTDNFQTFERNLIDWFYEYILDHSSLTTSYDVYRNYATLVFNRQSSRAPGEMDLRIAKKRALNYWIKYSSKFNNITATEHYLYGINKYRYWDGIDTQKTKEGFNFMVIAAKMDNNYANKVSDLYSNAYYNDIRNYEQAYYWAGVAASFSSRIPDSKIPKIVSYILGNEGVEKDLKKAYKLTFDTLSGKNEKDPEYNDLMFLIVNLCQYSDECNVDHRQLKTEYKAFTTCTICYGNGKVTCSRCEGTGRIGTYRNNTEQCRGCSGFGYLKCTLYGNMPSKNLSSIFKI